MFADLLATPGVVEEVELRSSIGFMAYHGGNLERVTDVVARGAAEASGASLYTVCQPDDLRWHLPSAAIGSTPSPALQQFVDHVDVAISIHGYGRDGFWTSLLLGGRNRFLAGHVAACLRPALDGYEILDELDAIPQPLRGLHQHNPVNLPRSTGVQIELPPASAGWARRGPTRRPGSWFRRPSPSSTGCRPPPAAGADRRLLLLLLLLAVQSAHLDRRLDVDAGSAAVHPPDRGDVVVVPPGADHHVSRPDGQ